MIPEELGLQPGNGVLDLNFLQDPGLAVLHVAPIEFMRAACPFSLFVPPLSASALVPSCTRRRRTWPITSYSIF